MSGQTDKQEHELYLKHRKELKIVGVRDVDSFDETGAVLRTTDGILTVEGGELKIGVLDTERGVVTVSGRIDGLFYSGEGNDEKRGLLSRLFK